MKRILFTTAYAQSSKNSWRYALKLAQYFEARISIMHVYEDATTSLLPSNEFLDSAMLENLEAFNEEKHKEELGQLRGFVSSNTPKQFHQLGFSYIVTTGDIAEAILQEEREEHYDLLILGTTRTSRFSDKFFGSVTKRVIKKATSPVFLIPPMAQYRGINKIVYATNFEHGDSLAINHLMDWVQVFDAKLHLLHVYKKTYSGKQAAERMEKLMHTFQDVNEAGSLTTQLLEGHVAQSIGQYLELTRSDMIALTSHQKGFFSQLFEPSVTNRIAAEAMVPILIFK